MPSTLPAIAPLKAVGGVDGGLGLGFEPPHAAAATMPPGLRGALFEVGARSPSTPSSPGHSRPHSALPLTPARTGPMGTAASNGLTGMASSMGLQQAGGAGGALDATLLPPHVAAAASQLRSALEALGSSVDAALWAREQQNKRMLQAVKDSMPNGTPAAGTAGSSAGSTPARPASARALQRALCASRSVVHAGAGDRDRLSWVRGLVRQTESGQVYAAAAEAAAERERHAVEGGAAVPVDPATGAGRRGPLPSLRTARREDATALQAWLADTLQQVVWKAPAAAVAAQKAAAGGAEAGTGNNMDPEFEPPDASDAKATAGSGSSPAADAVPGAGEAGSSGRYAAELADAAQYVLGVAMEELRRQVSSECKERGELLGLLTDQLQGLAAMRSALAGEARVAEVSAQWAAVLTERDRLLTEEPDSSETSTAVGSLAAAGGLAADLVAAQQVAEAAKKRLKLAEAALSGEVQRREVAERQLSSAQELLRRQENEWLYHRSANQKLEGDLALLREQLEAARREAAAEKAAAAAALQSSQSGKTDVTQLEAALSRMRQQYEGNEILVVAQRQQIRDLEGALGTLREQQRDQAVALGKVGQVTEQYEAAAAALRADLAAEQQRCASMTSQLAVRDGQLAAAEATLSRTEAALQSTREMLAVAEAAALKAATEAEAEERRLRIELTDAVAVRRKAEARIADLEKEATTVSELVKLVARTLQLQGMEGVPGVNDKTWETAGPLGALQRVLGMTTTQLAMLFGQNEDAGKQLRAAQLKLEAEKDSNSKLQRELHESKTNEARMLREKEVSDMRLSTLEHELRAVQGEALKYKAVAMDCDARVKVQHETITALKAQVNELPPLKKRVDALTSDLDQCRKSDDEARHALDVTRQHLEQSEGQTRFYKREVEKLIGEIESLQDEIKGLRVTTAKMDVETARCKELQEALAALQHQLDVMTDSHSETLKQLELAKFFLQGLDNNGPGSPTRSSGLLGSPSSRGAVSPNRLREGSSIIRRESTSYARLGVVAADGEGEGLASSRPGSAAVGRPFSAAKRSPRGPGSQRLGSARSGLAVQVSGLASRPLSAVSAVSDDSIYHAEIPDEVAELLEQRGLSVTLANNNAKWSRIKMAIMAWFSSKLRARLTTALEQLAAKDLEIQEIHAKYLKEMVQREEYIAKELLPTLMPPILSGTQEAAREVMVIRAQIPRMRTDLDGLAATCGVLALALKGYRDREATLTDHACQTDTDADDWLRYVARLPPLPPNLALSLSSLTDSIVRIYVRAAATVEDVPTWGNVRHDSVYDAVMAHYTSQRAPDTFMADLVQDPESPVARLFSAAIANSKNTKVASFLYFCNLSPEGVHWPTPAWHFFLHVLHCLRVLLAGTWRVIVKKWAAPEGVSIPMPAVLDLVGNLFNVQSPGDLDGAISLRLAAIVTPGAAGPSVDLDALLLMLVREYSGGNCPRAPLLFPRRLTDGKLFNIFNTAGHNTHVETLKSQNATKFIGASAAKGVSVGTGSRPGTTSSSIMSPGTPPQLLGSPKATLLQPYGPLAPTDAHSARSFQAGPGGAGGPLPQGSALQHDQAAAFAAEMDEPVETLRSGLSSGSMTVSYEITHNQQQRSSVGPAPSAQSSRSRYSSGYNVSRR